MVTRIRAFFFALALLPLASCDGTSASDRPSEIRFEYSGTRTGVMHIRAAPATRGPSPDTTVSAQVTPGPEPFLVIEAYQRTSATRAQDFVVWTWTEAGPLDLSCPPAAPCPQVGGRLNASADGAVVSDREFFLLDSGTIEVTDASDGRVRGTFAGTGVLRAVEPEGPGEHPITVTGGTFDVALHPAP